MKSIIFPKECKKYIDLQCNGDLSLYIDMPEIKNIDKYLSEINPKNILDIGAGIGRASVYLHNKYKWGDSHYFLLDGDGGDTQYDQLRTEKGEYYNSFECAKLFCESNGLKITQLNANDNWINHIKKPLDLIYSFLAIGFHWPITFYLEDIYSVSKKDSLIIFGVRGIERKEWMDSQVNSIDNNKYEISDYILNPTKDRNSILVLKRK